MISIYRMILYTTCLIAFMITNNISYGMDNPLVVKNMKKCFDESLRKKGIQQTTDYSSYLLELQNLMNICISYKTTKTEKRNALNRLEHLFKSSITTINATDRQNAIDTLFTYIIQQISLGNNYAKEMAQIFLHKENSISNPSQESVDRIFEGLFQNSHSLLNDYKIYDLFAYMNHEEYLKQSKKAERILFNRQSQFSQYAPDLAYDEANLQELIRTQQITDDRDLLWHLRSDQLPHLNKYLENKKIHQIYAKSQIIFNEPGKVTAAVTLSYMNPGNIEDLFLLILEKDNPIDTTQIRKLSRESGKTSQESFISSDTGSNAPITLQPNGEETSEKMRSELSTPSHSKALLKSITETEEKKILPPQEPSQLTFAQKRALFNKR